eukprot:767271-Hanusia_phi.AAC.1
MATGCLRCAETSVCCQMNVREYGARRARASHLSTKTSDYLSCRTCYFQSCSSTVQCLAPIPAILPETC